MGQRSSHSSGTTLLVAGYSMGYFGLHKQQRRYYHGTIKSRDNGVVPGVANWILGSSMFQVLNRFTYGIFLTHVTLLYGVAYGRKTPVYFSEFDMVTCSTI